MAERSNIPPTQFQSTLPMKGATRIAANCALGGMFQSTLPMKGATDDYDDLTIQERVSIHAPNEGSDN